MNARLDAAEQRVNSMTEIAYGASAKPVAIPVKEILPWLLFAGFLAFTGIYFVGAEQGAMAFFPGHWIHEFVHDGRHVLGYPCH